MHPYYNDLTVRGKSTAVFKKPQDAPTFNSPSQGGYGDKWRV